jgi:hypothetical protein
MLYILRYSGQSYNCPDKYGKTFNYVFASETQTINRAVKRNRVGYVARILDRAPQKMWEIKLLVYRWNGARTKLLSFCQHTKNETHHDLCFPQRQTTRRRSFRKLSRSSTNYGKNKRYKPRIINEKNIVLGNKLWHLKWIVPP